MEKPIVSVIIPVYNKCDFIQETIDSVLRQEFDRFEIIVVDDGSTDGSLDVIRSFNDPRISVFSQQNAGVERARNFGLSLSTGALVVFLDADDLMSANRLNKQINRFDSNQDLMLLGTWANVIDHSGNVAGSICPPTSNDALQIAHLFRNQFVSSSVMIRRDAINDVGGFDETRGKRFAEDYDLWNKISKKGLIANIPEKLTTYRRLKASRSQSKDSSLLESARDISAEWLISNTKLFSSIEAARNFVLSVNGLDDFTLSNGRNLREALRTYEAVMGHLLPVVDFRRSDGLRKVVIQNKIHIVIWSVLGFIPPALQRKLFYLLNSLKLTRLTRFLVNIVGNFSLER